VGVGVPFLFGTSKKILIATTQPNKFISIKFIDLYYVSNRSINLSALTLRLCRLAYPQISFSLLPLTHCPNHAQSTTKRSWPISCFWYTGTDRRPHPLPSALQPQLWPQCTISNLHRGLGEEVVVGEVGVVEEEHQTRSFECEWQCGSCLQQWSQQTWSSQVYHKRSWE